MYLDLGDKARRRRIKTDAAPATLDLDEISTNIGPSMRGFCLVQKAVYARNKIALAFAFLQAVFVF